LLHRGWADAASQAGRGLSPTWGPRPSRRPALLAIDHVLTDRSCAVLTTSTHLLTGTDHRARRPAVRRRDSGHIDPGPVAAAGDDLAAVPAPEGQGDRTAVNAVPQPL